MRPSFGRHPRLAIWGPLEARLQRADLLVLGGLNEGTWPPAVETGPWINRPMRAALGLPQPERRIGLSAHDFAAALAAERVLLTRAEREGGAPTVPSRWLARLDALFGYEPGKRPRAAGIHPARPAHATSPGPRRSIGPDEPTSRGRVPSRGRRSRRGRRGSRSPASSNGGAIPTASMRGSILGLQALDPLEAELGAADRGSAPARRARRVPEGLSRRACCRPMRSATSRRWASSISKPCSRHRPSAPSGGRASSAWRAGSSPPRTPAAPPARKLLASETNGASRRPLGRRSRIKARRRPDRRDRARRLGDHRLQDRPRALAQGAGRPVRAAAPARGGDGRAGRLRGDQGQGARRAPLLLAGQRPGRWRRRSGRSRTATTLVPAMLALVAQDGRRTSPIPSTPYAALPWPEFIPHFNDYAHLERVAEWSTAGGGEE